MGAVLTGCPSPSEPQPDPDPVASSIAIEPEAVEVADGDETTLSATVYDQRGEALSPQPAITWATADAAIASVDAGLLTGEFPGETTVTASAGDLSVDASVTVLQHATLVAPLAGDEQRAGPGETLAEEVAVRVLDRHENPVVDVEVEFSVEAGGGSVSPGRVIVDGNGEARTAWTLGTTGEMNRVGARVVDGSADAALFTAAVVQSETVPSSGGQVESAGGEVSLDFPAGAVDGDLEVSIEPAEARVDPPANTTPIEGTTFRFEPSGTTFAEPVEIAIRFNEADLPASISAADLRIFRESEDGWQLVGSSRPDPESGVVRGTIRGFSVYSVMAISRSTASVSAPVPSQHVHEMRLAVTAPDILSPIEAVLEIEAGQAFGSVEVPAGSNRTFTVVALDSGGTETHRGAQTADLEAGEDLELTVAEMVGLDGSVTVTIEPDGLTLTLETGGASIGVGDSRLFTATVRDPEGNAIDGAHFSWASANPALAGVDTEGSVTGRRAGETRISVSYQGFAASAALTIEP